LYMFALYLVKTSNDFYGIQYSVKHLSLQSPRKSNCRIR